MFKLRITLDREGLVQVDLEHSSDEERDTARRFYEYLKPALGELGRKAQSFAQEELKK